MTDTPPADDRQVRPFADWLQDLRKGRTHNDLSEALNELVEAVCDTKKKGSLTFKVEIKPEGSFVTVSDQVTLRLPDAERDASIFYVDRNANLTREDPNQPRLPLREVGADPQEHTA